MIELRLDEDQTSKSIVRILNQWLNLGSLAFHWWENEKSEEEEEKTKSQKKEEDEECRTRN